MPALSFSEFDHSKVLPLDKTTSTGGNTAQFESCLLYTSPSPRDS